MQACRAFAVDINADGTMEYCVTQPAGFHPWCFDRDGDGWRFLGHLRLRAQQAPRDAQELIGVLERDGAQTVPSRFLDVRVGETVFALDEGGR